MACQYIFLDNAKLASVTEYILNKVKLPHLLSINLNELLYNSYYLKLTITL